MNTRDFDALELPQMSPEQIESRAIWREKNQHIISRVGFLLSMYYLDGHRNEKRDGLLKIVSEFIGFFRERITSYQKENSKRLTPWDGNGIPKCYLDLSHQTKRSALYYIHLIEQTDRNNEDPELCRLMAFASDEKTPWRPLSAVKIHIPPTWFFRNVETFVDAVNRWCGYVHCQHGSAGLGVLSNSGVGFQAEPSHYFFLKRYPGLEFDAFGSYLSESAAAEGQAYRRPRSSNWLTMLGDENLALLGGPHAVAQQIKPGMEFLGYDGGAIIRAGQTPQWGDATKGDIPRLYSEAAAIIKPIRFEEYKFGFIKVPDPLDYTEESLKWLRRFD